MADWKYSVHMCCPTHNTSYAKSEGTVKSVESAGIVESTALLVAESAGIVESTALLVVESAGIVEPTALLVVESAGIVEPTALLVGNSSSQMYRSESV